MTEHQRRLWRTMIDNIDSYKRHALTFSAMVGALEGALDAGDFRDRALVTKWYELWTRLETARAAGGDSVAHADVDDVVEAMRQFLRERLAAHGADNASPSDV